MNVSNDWSFRRLLRTKDLRTLRNYINPLLIEQWFMISRELCKNLTKTWIRLKKTLFAASSQYIPWHGHSPDFWCNFRMHLYDQSAIELRRLSHQTEPLYWRFQSMTFQLELPWRDNVNIVFNDSINWPYYENNSLISSKSELLNWVLDWHGWFFINQKLFLTLL